MTGGTWLQPENGLTRQTTHLFTLPSGNPGTVVYYTLSAVEDGPLTRANFPCFQYTYPQCPTNVGSVKARSTSTANLTDGTLMPLASPLLFGGPGQGPISNRLRVFGQATWGLYFYASVQNAFQTANFRFRIRHDNTNTFIAETFSGLLGPPPLPQFASVAASGRFTTTLPTNDFSIFCTRSAGTGFLRWNMASHNGGFAIIRDPQF